MNQLGVKFGVIQNVGWLDRLLRVIGGAILLAVPVSFILVNLENASWASYVVLVSVYPLLTGIIGWDPVYEIAKVKTCGMSERNPCGTFPFEVDAALGHHPIPRSDIEHSLENSRHQH
jgi:hypothetical protein